MQKILEVKNVTKYYGAGSVVTKALDGISLTVEKGEFVAIMGASGSGKSTLLNVVSTIDRVSSGEICVEGRNICSMKEDELSAFRRDKLGFVFQDYNLLDTLTVGENIALPLNLKRVPEDETKKELRRVAEALGVADQLEKFPYELSGGQRQRAACARAIITSPDGRARLEKFEASHEDVRADERIPRLHHFSGDARRRRGELCGPRALSERREALERSGAGRPQPSRDVRRDSLRDGGAGR